MPQGITRDGRGRKEARRSCHLVQHIKAQLPPTCSMSPGSWWASSITMRSHTTLCMGIA